MTRLLLLFLVTGVLCSLGVAGKKLEISASSWASYQWAEPWHGSWGTHTGQAEDAHTTQDFYPEDVPALELPEKQLQKRHYLHYISPANPERLERPRKRHFEVGEEDEPVFEVWEQPPLLAKEGITSEEAIWVPYPGEQPLQVIKQGYSWGSKEFDHRFGRHPRLTPDTVLHKPPYPPPSTYPPSVPPPPPPPPHTSAPRKHSSLPPLPPPTTPYTVLVEKPFSPEVSEPAIKVAKPHSVPSYHQPKPQLYHHQPVHNYPNTPRKYYLSEDIPQRHKNQYGIRKYYLNNEPAIVVTDSEDLLKVPVIADNEIDIPDDLTNVPKRVSSYHLASTLTSAEDEIAPEPGNAADSSHGDDESGHQVPQKPKKKQPHHPPSYSSPPYGYKLQPRPHHPSPTHSHKPPPYGHYLHQRPLYPNHNIYPHTPATIRKYYLNPSTSGPPPPPPPPSAVVHSLTMRKKEPALESPSSSSPSSDEGVKDSKASVDLSPFDVYEMLRMPRNADSTSWQNTRFGSRN